MITTIISAIIVLGILIFVHELGHLIAAKRSGIKVLCFSLGMGPKLLGKKIGDTEYIISLVPLGGYVKMAGVHPDEEGVKDVPYNFLAKPWYIRIIVAFSGPFMNIILALLLFGLLCYVFGLRIPDYEPKIGEVTPNSPAEKAGLLLNDVILSVNDKEITSWMEMVEIIQEQLETADEPQVQLKILYTRNDSTNYTVLRFSRDEPIGITPDVSIPAVIGGISVGLPAYEAGLQEGDTILTVAGTEVDQWSELAEIINSHPNQQITIKFKRNQKVFTKPITPIGFPTGDGKQIGLIGIEAPIARYYTKHLNIFESAVYSTKMTVGVVVQIYYGLWKLVSNISQMKSTVGGPILIAEMAGEETQKGIDNLIRLIAFISVIVTVFNLLPIPILDGGHIVFSLIEGIRGKPLSAKKQMILQNIGLAVLILIFVFAFLNDISRGLKRYQELDKLRNEEYTH